MYDLSIIIRTARPAQGWRVAVLGVLRSFEKVRTASSEDPIILCIATTFAHAVCLWLCAHTSIYFTLPVPVSSTRHCAGRDEQMSCARHTR